ncbi:MAG: tetratricopeptide repeat protein [Planctomycetota bacterium]
MKRPLSILGATAAVLLLMFGIYRVTRPQSALMSPEEAQAELETLGGRFTAAIQNKRDVTPLLEPVRLIVAQHPRSRDGQTLLGQIYLELENPEKAYDALATALSIDPQGAQLQNLAGTAAMMLDEVTAGESHHRLAVQQEPDNPELLLPLADVLIKTARWDEARDILLRSLELDLTQHAPHAAMSDVFVGRGQEGDSTLAIEHMEKALAKLPLTEEWAEDRVIYARKLARLFADRDEPIEAVAVLDSLSDAARFSPEVLADMAGYLDANGQTALAGLQYEMALAERPAEARYAAEAARWYLAGGDASAARAMLERLEGIAPDHPAITKLRAALP